MTVRTCKDTGQIKPEGFLKQTGKTLLGAWVFAANHKGLTTLHTPHLLGGFYVGTQFSCLSSPGGEQRRNPASCQSTWLTEKDASGCGRLIRIIAPPVPPSPGQARTAGLPSSL